MEGLYKTEEGLQLTDWRSPVRVVMRNVVKIREGPSVTWWTCGYHCQFFSRVWCDKGSCSRSSAKNSLVAEQPGIVVGKMCDFEKMIRTKKNIINLFRCFKLQRLARHSWRPTFFPPFCTCRHTAFLAFLEGKVSLLQPQDLAPVPSPLSSFGSLLKCRLFRNVFLDFPI